VGSPKLFISSFSAGQNRKPLCPNPSKDSPFIPAHECGGLLARLGKPFLSSNSMFLSYRENQQRSSRAEENLMKSGVGHSRELAPGNGYTGALAVKGYDWSLSCWQLSNCYLT
jgi:hypothetical protein